MRPFHKPMRRPGDVIESWSGDGDPADLGTLAHDTATALLHGVREAADPAMVDKVISYADEHGIDDVAELWASAAPDTLPAALWRVYLVRHTVRSDREEVGYLFRRGSAVDPVNQAISGSPNAPTPDEVVDLATSILRGAFTGDFAVALERAAAFCRVIAAGARELGATPGSRSATHEDEAGRYLRVADELTREARLWRLGQLA